MNNKSGEYKECVNGSFIKGINIGVHDDWGWANMCDDDNALDQCVDKNDQFYLAANIVNIKAHCTKYLNDTGSAIFEGDNPNEERWPTDYDKKLYVLQAMRLYYLRIKIMI